jgi:hypothetical protein
VTCDDVEWIAGRIAAKKAEVAALDAAITALNAGAQSYQLDTGQTRQSVTRAQLGQLASRQRDLENDILMLQQRLNGCGSIHVRPSW